MVLMLTGVADVMEAAVEVETRVDNEPAFDPCCCMREDASSVADDNGSVP